MNLGPYHHMQIFNLEREWAIKGSLTEPQLRGLENLAGEKDKPIRELINIAYARNNAHALARQLTK